MLVSVDEVDSLFTKSFQRILEIYKYTRLVKYIVYKKYLFLFVFSSDEEGVNVSISSDMCIFYNDKFDNLNKKSLKKILDERIIKG